jgi:hypothetical protein
MLTNLLDGAFSSPKQRAVIRVDKLQHLSENISPYIIQFYLRNITTAAMFHYMFCQQLGTTCHNVPMSWESCCANLTNKSYMSVTRNRPQM